VPIPGTTKQSRLSENVGSADVALTPNEARDIDAALSAITIRGGRYPDDVEALTGL
jgi:aryl-alcohol dehydrogenase-like predicted oxidoreductase